MTLTADPTTHTMHYTGITGDVVLEDVRLQPGILRHLLGPEAGADLELARGTVKELRLSIPWARILAQAQPVLQATLRTVEVVVVRRRKKKKEEEEEVQGEGSDGPDVEEQKPQQPPQPQRAPVEASPGAKGPAAAAAPPGWLRSLGKKLAMNVTLKVENLTVQYEEEGTGVVASAYIWCVCSLARLLDLFV